MDKYIIKNGNTGNSNNASEDKNEDSQIVQPNKKKKTDTYQKKWEKLYDWLEAEKKNDDIIYMFCKYCRKYKKKTPFANGGCTSYKTTSLQRHSACNEHLQSLESSKYQKNMEAATSKVNEKSEIFLNSCLKSALFIATNELPNSLFGNLQQFAKIQGCESTSSKNPHIKYDHSESVNQLQASIARVIENKLLEDIKKSKVCSIICDETCDVSNEKHLGVNIRYVKNGSALIKFLDNVLVSDGRAETLTNAIQEMLKSKEIDMSKVIGLGCDGANVMLGKKSGVATRLKALNPCIIAVHCAAHRLALVLQNATKSIQCVKSYNDTIKSIFVYFNASPVRSTKLNAIQKLMQGFSLKYVELHSVRWLSLHKAVNILYVTLDSLIVFLESQVAENNDATASGLLRAVRSIRFMYITHILIDILPILTNLNKIFQSDTADLALIKPCVETAMTKLNKLKDEPGEGEKSFISNVMVENDNSEMIDLINNSNSTVCQENNDIADDDEMLTGDIQRTSSAYYTVLKEKMIKNSSLDNLSKMKGSLINEVLEGIARRFPKEVFDVLSCFEAYDPLYATSINITECKDKVKRLADHFSPYVTPEELFKEYDDVHILLKNSYKGLKFHQVAELFLNRYNDVYPNSVTLYEIYLVIPITSASVERSFSTQNRIKNKFRNRLAIKNLSNIIRISDEHIDMETFNYGEAAREFNIVKNRRY